MIKGKLYRLTVRGKLLPNLYRFEGEANRHCQLHGDYIGKNWLFLKRRNSEKRPWGSAIGVFNAEDVTAEEVE